MVLVMYIVRISRHFSRKHRLNTVDYPITVAIVSVHSHRCRDHMSNLSTRFIEAIVLMFTTAAVANGFGNRSILPDP